MHYLYKITNRVNGKNYIGQTIDPLHRWADHKNSAKNPKQIIHYAIKKYGIDNFEFEVIACCMTQDQANDLETQLVEQYQSHISTGKGYNVSLGGMNAPKSEAFKQIMREWHKAHPEHIKYMRQGHLIWRNRFKEQGLPFPIGFKSGHAVKKEWIEAIIKAKLGTKASEETKQKQSIGLKQAWIDGKFDGVEHKGFTGSHTEETKQKLREVSKGKHYSPETEFKVGHNLGIPMSEETKRKIGAKNAINHKGKHCNPRTEIKPGQRISPATEFKKGLIPWNKGKKVNTIPWNKGKKVDVIPWNKKELPTQEIKQKYQNGQSIRSLAREYRVDRTVIKNRIKQN